MNKKESGYIAPMRKDYTEMLVEELKKVSFF